MSPCYFQTKKTCLFLCKEYRQEWFNSYADAKYAYLKLRLLKSAVLTDYFDFSDSSFSLRLKKQPLLNRGGGLVYHFSSQAKISGATMVASLSTINFGVSMASFPQVIFSLGTAPE